MSKRSEPDVRIPCECGGTLKPTTVREFDLTRLMGVSAVLTKGQGLKCDRCHGETLEGTTINGALAALAADVVKQSDRLNAEHARFLRKYLLLTQQELAERMALVRETVADWERGASPISPQHDLMLRAITVARLVEQGALPKQDLIKAIHSARFEPPRKTSPRIIIPKVA